MANPKIVYSQGKITPGRVLSEKLEHDAMETESFSMSYDERVLLLNYLNQTKSYLEKINAKCAQVIDTYSDSQCILDALESQSSINDRSIFDEKPSVFLNKAYARQTFHEDDAQNQNRFQKHIGVGLQFKSLGNSKPSSLSAQQKLFHDVGTMIAATNTAMSQIDRVINALGNTKLNNEELAGVILALPNVLKMLSQEVNESPIMETGFFSNLRNDLMEVLGNSLNWIVSRLGFGSPNNTSGEKNVTPSESLEEVKTENTENGTNSHP